MTKYNCIIVDDEPQARKILETYLGRCDDMNVIASLSNAKLADEFISSKRVDLMFLDINMPEIDGLALLKLLKTPPVTILTTAYSEYALEGFELDVTDYLLKPIRFERFSKAIIKAKKEIDHRTMAVEVTALADSLKIKTGGEVLDINYNEILFIQSLGNYIKVVTSKKNYLTLQTIKETEDKIPKSSFVRTHKSFIVNINKISEVGNEEIKVGKYDIPIGKTYKKYFTSFIDKK